MFDLDENEKKKIFNEIDIDVAKEKIFELSGFKRLKDGEIEYHHIEDYLKCSHHRCSELPSKYIEVCIDSVISDIPYCNKHFFQMQVERDFKEGLLHEEYEEDIPIVYCRNDDKVHYYFFCKYCQERHYHGIGEGHRWAHCRNLNSPYKEKGYILKLAPERSLELEKEYTDRYTLLNAKEIRKGFLYQIVGWDKEMTDIENDTDTCQ